MTDHLEVIEPDDEDGFCAACVCGWEGTYHDTFGAARDEWRRHIPAALPTTEGTEP